MPHAAVNGLRLYYEEEGTGPPLVLLSGATMAFDSAMRGGWARLRPYLAQRFHVVQFDQRGHGRTDNPGGGAAYALATLAADAAALIEQLGLPPVHVAGWSEGGIVGLGLALDHPSVLRSLIGIGTNYTNDAKTVAELATLDPDGLERDRSAVATALAQRHDPHHHLGYWKELLRWIVTSETDVPAYTAADMHPRVRQVRPRSDKTKSRWSSRPKLRQRTVSTMLRSASLHRPTRMQHEVLAITSPAPRRPPKQSNLRIWSLCD